MDSKNNWSRVIHWFVSKPKTAGFLVFFLLNVIAFYIIFQQYHIAKEVKHSAMRKTLMDINQNIGQNLKNCYTSTLTLALTINDEGNPENFDSIAKKLIDANRSINAIQLVPKGIITYVYPLEGNEAALGLNILTSKIHKKEALKAIENQKMYFAGPFLLKQGGMGILGRLPVYNKNAFWGFSAVIIKLETLLKMSGVNTIDKSRYSFQFSKINPLTFKEDFFLINKTDLATASYVSSYIADGDFKLYLIDKRPNDFVFSLLIPSILGFALTFLFGYLTTSTLKKPAELQLLVSQQEERLLKSEVLFKTIFDKAAVGIINVDPITGKFIEANSRFCEIMGYSQKELKEKTYQSLFYNDEAAIGTSINEQFNDNLLLESLSQQRFITKNKDAIWVNISVSPLWKTHEQSTTSIAVIEDITLRKESEELIAKSEIRFKSLFEDSPLPLFEEDFSQVKKRLEDLYLVGKSEQEVMSFFQKNQDEVRKCIALVKVINVNQEGIRFNNTENKEELKQSLSNFIQDETIDLFLQQLIAITQGKNKLNIESKITTTNESSRHINLRWNVISGYEQSLERVIVSTEDITSRKTAEKLIINSQNRIENLINTIDGIVWECDPDTLVFNFVSKKVEEILGYTKQEWLSSPTFWLDHIYEKDRETSLKFYLEKTKNKEARDLEYRMISKDGKLVWLKDIVTIIYENDKIISLRGIMIDITKTKEVQEDLNQSFTLVNEQNKRLLNFSYIVSHNLRSHTSNISSLTSLLETVDSEEERIEFTKLLKTVSNSLNDTLENLNEVVNIQTSIGLVTEDLNLSSYVDKSLAILRDQIILKKVTITSTIPDTVVVNYNPAYLESILHNVISNAIRYSSVARESTVNIDYYIEDGKKIVQITDNGIGIDLNKYKHKIFGMYKTFNDNPDSKGIGLFITKNQIESMGGSIMVESTLDVGTKFKIYIK
jgi:PAS domain S-box-containing protein